MGRRERAVQLDGEAERENGLVAVVRVFRSGLETDACTVHAVRHVGGVGEFQRFGDVQARTRVLTRLQRTIQGVARRGGAHLRYGHSLDAVALAGDVQTDLIAHGDVFHGGNLDVGVARLGVHRQVTLRARLAYGRDGHDLIFLERVRYGGTVGAVADGHLLAHGEMGGRGHGDVGGAHGNLDAVAARKRLPDSCGGAGTLHTTAERGTHRPGRCGGGSVHRLHGALFLADDNLVTRLDTVDAADIDGGVALCRIHGQAGTGHAQQVESLGGKLGSRRDLDVGEIRDVGGMFAHGPARKVHFPVRRVVKFDETVGDAEFVNLHRLGIANLQPANLLLSIPGGHGLQIAVEGGL